MDVIVVERCDVDTWNPGPPTLLAVVSNEDAAKRWIQDEVDGKHNTSHLYAKGHDADWWINIGVFRLTTRPVLT